jgi:hypothetical protein
LQCRVRIKVVVHFSLFTALRQRGLSLLLLSFVSCALDEGEWSTSRCGRFSLRGKCPCILCWFGEGGGGCRKAGVGVWAKSVCNPRPGTEHLLHRRLSRGVGIVPITRCACCKRNQLQWRVTVSRELHYGDVLWNIFVLTFTAVFFFLCVMTGLSVRRS